MGRLAKSPAIVTRRGLQALILSGMSLPRFRVSDGGGIGSPSHRLAECLPKPAHPINSGLPRYAAVP